MNAGAAAVVLISALTACGGEPDAVVPDSAPVGRPRILVVTHTAGFRHSSIPVAEQTLADLASTSGDFEVAFARTADDVQRMLTPAALDGFAAVAFANTSGDLGLPDLTGFLDWIGSGRGFVGVHAASDTFHEAPAYLEMLGGEFEKHGAQCEVDVNVDDPTHPATKHLAPGFRIFDEIYEFSDNPRPRVSVLLSLDRHPPDGHPEAGAPGDFPLSWTKLHGRGRVFYTAFGHREEVWHDQRFREHILGGVRWSLSIR